MTFRLTKHHGLGNDFLVHLTDDAAAFADRAAWIERARRWCHRHHGVGADGLLVGLHGRAADGVDLVMLLVNADGSIAEMSGNGIRALAWAAAAAGLGGDTLVVDTGGGRRTLELARGADGRVVAATVDMGPVSFDPATIPVDADSPFDLEAEFHGVTYRGDAAGMGNPHWVCFVDDVAGARVTQHGPHLETDPRFPRHTNVEFVAPDGVNGLRMRVWERGVGETLSCGTGACASAAVAHRRDLVGPRVTVRVPGGELTVEVGDTLRLGGPVVHVFDVTVDPAVLGVEAG